MSSDERCTEDSLPPRAFLPWVLWSPWDFEVATSPFTSLKFEVGKGWAGTRAGGDAIVDGEEMDGRKRR